MTITASNFSPRDAGSPDNFRGRYRMFRTRPPQEDGGVIHDNAGCGVPVPLRVAAIAGAADVRISWNDRSDMNRTQVRRGVTRLIGTVDLRSIACA